MPQRPIVDIGLTGCWLKGMVRLALERWWSSVLMTTLSRANAAAGAYFTNESITKVSTTSSQSPGSSYSYPSITATGLESAQSCLAQQSIWLDLGAAWETEHGQQLETWTAIGTSVNNITLSPPEVVVTSITTLCDGNPRVVGQVTTLGGEYSVSSQPWSWTWTSTDVPALSFPMTAPCTVRPTDCVSVFSSWSEVCSPMSWSPESCWTSPSCATFSTTGPDLHGTCTDARILASKASILYWPVETVPGPGNLCNGIWNPTIPGTRTAIGPNTFVTANVTITSPSVGVVLVGVSRQDGCITTLATTVLAIPPDELTSIQGQRADAVPLPFSLGDLNYHCASLLTARPGATAVPLSERPDCYQAVPSLAYFSGASWWLDHDGDDQEAIGATIFPGYAPNVAMPTAMLNDFHTIFGMDCSFYHNGVWDPPSALSEYSYVAGVTTPVWDPSAATTTAADRNLGFYSAIATPGSNVVPSEAPSTVEALAHESMQSPTQTMQHSPQSMQTPTQAMQDSSHFTYLGVSETLVASGGDRFTESLLHLDSPTTSIADTIIVTHSQTVVPNEAPRTNAIISGVTDSATNLIIDATTTASAAAEAHMPDTVDSSTPSCSTSTIQAMSTEDLRKAYTSSASSTTEPWSFFASLAALIGLLILMTAL